jgi:hypothetical protein
MNSILSATFACTNNCLLPLPRNRVRLNGTTLFELTKDNAATFSSGRMFVQGLN